MLSVKDDSGKDHNRLNTIIGPGSRIKGDISVQGGLRVDGAVEGKVISTGQLIVGKEGVIKAPTIEASSANIGGTIEGDITAHDRARLEPTARVTGNLVTSVLIIEEGAIFRGNSDFSGSGADK